MYPDCTICEFVFSGCVIEEPDGYCKKEKKEEEENNGTESKS